MAGVQGPVAGPSLPLGGGASLPSWGRAACTLHGESKLSFHRTAGLGGLLPVQPAGLDPECSGNGLCSAPGATTACQDWPLPSRTPQQRAARPQPCHITSPRLDSSACLAQRWLPGSLGLTHWPAGEGQGGAPALVPGPRPLADPNPGLGGPNQGSPHPDLSRQQGAQQPSAALGLAFGGPARGSFSGFPALHPGTPWEASPGPGGDSQT